MIQKSLKILGLVCILYLFNSCGDSRGSVKLNPNEIVSNKDYNDLKKNSDNLDKLNKEYRDIPDDKIMENGGEKSAVYNELKAKYKEQLLRLKKEVELTGAKFVVVIISPGVGRELTAVNRYGHPFIKEVCKQNDIELYDFSDNIAAQDYKIITQAPKDGHWSKKGAVFLASLFTPIIKKHSADKCTVTYTEKERPDTYGDLPPHDDEFLDGGKDLPYHLQANAQGLRNNHDVVFPKTKQRVLILGGSYIYSPFLDNEYIMTNVLEKQMPNVEVLNSAMISSTVDDYLTLFEEKAKYCEPDLIIMHTNGGDITDLYFTNRNHLSRKHIPYYPTKIELEYYNKTYKK